MADTPCFINMNIMSKSKIIVCAHKKDFMAQNDVYMPLQVGKALSSVDLKVQGDDEGDNISIKNPNYCELTGLYWAWKNLRDVDYVGLAHYRRYFNFKRSGIGVYCVTDFINSGILDVNPVTILEGYDIILPEPTYMDHSIADAYIYAHVIEDFYIMNRVILRHYPDYEQTIKDFFFRDNRWIAYNMFFTSKKVFYDYCEWLFPILCEIEHNVRMSGYKFQKRIFGFMSELLLPLYCIHNQLKVKFMPICMIGENTEKPQMLRTAYLKWRNNIEFAMMRPRYKNIDCYGRLCHVDSYLKMDNINV